MPRGAGGRGIRVRGQRGEALSSLGSSRVVLEWASIVMFYQLMQIVNMCRRQTL